MNHSYQTHLCWKVQTRPNFLGEVLTGAYFFGVGGSDLGLFLGGDVCDFMAVGFCFILFSGNGKLAASIDSDSGIFIRLNRALSLPVKYYPVVSTKIINTKAKGLAVNFVNLLSQKKSWNLWIISGKLQNCSHRGQIQYIKVKYDISWLFTWRLFIICL